MENLISIIIPVFNAENYIFDSINSILNQTYRNMEIIIIDDGSTDATFDLLTDLEKKDKRIKVIKKENSGIVDALNLGLHLSKGEYISRMDADDICEPDRIRLQKKFLDENRDYLCVGTGVKVFGAKNFKYKYPLSDFGCKSLLTIAPCFAHPAVMFRADVVRREGIKYKKDYQYAEDYKFWVDLSKFGKFRNLNYYGLNYRVHERQTSEVKRSIQQKVHSIISHEYLMSNFNLQINTEDLKHFLFLMKRKDCFTFKYFSMLLRFLSLNVDMKTKYRIFFRYCKGFLR